LAGKKYNLTELRTSQQEWKKVLEEALDPDNREIFINRKKAVDMYIDGVSDVSIKHETGIHETKITKLIEKCARIDPATNEPYGYAALLPYRRIEGYKRAPGRGSGATTAGLFEQLLQRYPSLAVFITNNYFGKKETTLEKNMQIPALHSKFLIECRKLGINDDEYPFNTASKGQRSLRRYVNELKSQNPSLAIKREGKDARQKYRSTGKGRKYSTIPLAPYSLVQLDGHQIDMLYTVPVTNSDGSVLNLPATRLWLIAVIDAATRAILGYSLTSGENYSQTDVLAAIKDAIQPRVRIEFTIPGFRYPEGGGFPCFAIEEANWAIFDAIMLDNAKAQLAHDVVNKITEKLRCAISFGPVATPETRSIIERFFGTLEENGYHRTVSATGSNARDAKRDDAEKNAVNYGVTYNDLTELTEYLIATYNNSAHTGLSGRTPIQVMEDRIKNTGMAPCIASSKMKETAAGLTHLTVERTVRGTFSSGKRPYISYEGVEYRNEAISISDRLVGTKLFIEVDPDDISSVHAYTEDGVELGHLSAVGIWGRRSHSLKTRKEALKFANSNKTKNSPFYATLAGYEEELRNRAAQSRSARTKGERIKREQANSNKPDVPGNAQCKEAAPKDPAARQPSKKDSISGQVECDISDDYINRLDGISFEDAYKRGLFK